MAKNRNLTESQLANLKTDAGPGRPKGQKNYKTLYREAIIKIATATGQDPDEFELEIVEQAIRKARNGDISFYKDIMDRLHGKPLQPTQNQHDVNIFIDDEAKHKAKQALSAFVGDTGEGNEAGS